MEETVCSRGSPVPRDRALVLYKAYLPALTTETKLKTLRVHYGVCIADPVTIIIAVVVAIVVAAVIVIAAAIITQSANQIPKPNFGLSDTGGFTNGSPRYGIFGPIQNTASGELPLPIIYGEIKYGGNAIYQDRWDVEEVKRLMSLCEGEIESITDVRANDVPLAELDGCSSSQYTGTASQTVDSRASSYVNGLRHVAYIALTLKTSDRLKGGNPTITCVVKGMKVKTWDGTQWTTTKSWSANPAAILRDYLTSTRYGVGLPEEDIDDPSFGEVYDYCAALIDDNDGGTEARFRLDIAIDAKRPHLDILKDMLMTFGGALTFYGNKLKLRVERSEAPVQDFTMDNIVENSFKFELMSADQSPNRIKVQYIDPGQNYAKIFAMAEDTLAQEKLAARQGGDGVKQSEYPLLGITRFTQASRMAQQYLNLVKYAPLAVVFKAPLKVIHCEPFDIITVSHDVPGWTNKPFRILGTSEAEDDSIEIVAREHNPTIYSDRFSSVIVQFDYGSPPNPYRPVEDVTNLSLQEVGITNIDGDLISSIHVNWTPPPSTQNLAYYIVDINKDGEGFKEVVLLDSSATSYDIIKVIAGSTYEVRVRTVSTKGIISSGTSDDIDILGINNLPADVTNFQVIQSGSSLLFSWNPTNDADLRYYEIREGLSWESGNLVASGILGTSYELYPIPSGTRSYWIKARDTVGQYSLNPGSDSITILGAPDTNIVLTMREWFFRNGELSSGLEWTRTADYSGGQYYREALGVKTDALGDQETELLGDDPALVMLGETGYLSAEQSYITQSRDLGKVYEATVILTRNIFSVTAGILMTDISYSDDTLNFSAYAPWVAGTYNHRSFKFKHRFSISDGAYRLNLLDTQEDFDVPDIFEEGANVVIEVGGTTVNFTRDFSQVQAVVVTPLGSTPVVAMVTSITKDGFIVTIYNLSGVDVGGTINWLVRGY